MRKVVVYTAAGIVLIILIFAGIAYNIGKEENYVRKCGGRA